MDDGQGNRFETDRVKDALQGAGIPWAIAAGAAVYLYTRSRPPTDLDILVRPEDLRTVGDLLGSPPERETEPWGELDRVVVGRMEIAGRLTIRVGGEIFLYYMDEEMVERIRTATFEGLEVPILSPEDVMALKLVLQRSPEQGKHDLEDVAALVAGMDIDRAYLGSRLRRIGAEKRARSLLVAMLGDG